MIIMLYWYNMFIMDYIKKIKNFIFYIFYVKKKNKK